jgi:glycosyltransferase involved in cell wall biosynthesis|tara:strand:+ start:22825 stop:23448 length:624 start_codon:yes stop_codon:yes gene_type:complete
MKISYAITVCNELEEITTLLNFLQTNIKKEDEIVIQYDEKSVTDSVLDYLKLIDKMHSNHKVIGFPLNKDFASFKNNLKSHCSGDYIFQIDADEIPHESLVEVINQVLDTNPVDVIFLPRVNTVEGLTDEHIKKWGWNVNDKGWVNFPDYQTRIYKNTEDVTWMNKVHERITGYNTVSNFPAEEQWSLYHHKEIDRQETQNKFYDTI